MNDLLKFLSLWVLALVLGLLIYFTAKVVDCAISGDPKSFSCFMAKGIVIHTDNSFSLGFGIRTK